ncbi:MAG TPA: GtrA family protein [Dehalococcoidia bacterium]|nr:GtrA family protein [Dehalococcoidia bacterium]
MPRLAGLLLSRWARPLRFALVGGVCGLIQLALLVALLRLRVESLTANVLAYLLSAQVNFLLSNHFIWHDRWSRRASARDLLRRWLRFHLSIAGTFALSQAVFVGARALTAPVIASALGIGISALANFAIQDRLTFARLAPAAPVRPARLPRDREAA